MQELDYLKSVARVYRYGEEHGVKVLTAAKYAWRETNILEARRHELYG